MSSGLCKYRDRPSLSWPTFSDDGDVGSLPGDDTGSQSPYFSPDRYEESDVDDVYFTPEGNHATVWRLVSSLNANQLRILQQRYISRLGSAWKFKVAGDFHPCDSNPDQIYLYEEQLKGGLRLSFPKFCIHCEMGHVVQATNEELAARRQEKRRHKKAKIEIASRKSARTDGTSLSQIIEDGTEIFTVSPFGRAAPLSFVPSRTRLVPGSTRDVSFVANSVPLWWSIPVHEVLGCSSGAYLALVEYKASTEFRKVVLDECDAFYIQGFIESREKTFMIDPNFPVDRLKYVGEDDEAKFYEDEQGEMNADQPPN
ncbi:hypothetical protein O6P43_032124 [Quillaja saponaria]|uniref:Uncharacterized protein n=1 Tax=Quillaja saponaria TaxID=32244 RepID=A0AAD7KWX5_QUISA|nr:hypothetical protein O6P43_032124 [Quillaja saponaria]